MLELVSPRLRLELEIGQRRALAHGQPRSFEETEVVMHSECLVNTCSPANLGGIHQTRWPGVVAKGTTSNAKSVQTKVDLATKHQRRESCQNSHTQPHNQKKKEKLFYAPNRFNTGSNSFQSR